MAIRGISFSLLHRSQRDNKQTLQGRTKKTTTSKKRTRKSLNQLAGEVIQALVLGIIIASRQKFEEKNLRIILVNRNIFARQNYFLKLFCLWITSYNTIMSLIVCTFL